MPANILGIGAGATENAAALKGLLTHVRDRGLATEKKYLFVIDSAKALRAAIEDVSAWANRSNDAANTSCAT